MKENKKGQRVEYVASALRSSDEKLGRKWVDEEGRNRTEQGAGGQVPKIFPLKIGETWHSLDYGGAASRAGEYEDDYWNLVLGKTSRNEPSRRLSGARQVTLQTVYHWQWHSHFPLLHWVCFCFHSLIILRLGSFLMWLSWLHHGIIKGSNAMQFCF